MGECAVKGIEDFRESVDHIEHEVFVLDAIEASIDKWKNVVDKKHTYSKTTSCPLCDIYKTHGMYTCCDCVIRKVTDQENCYGTGFYSTTIWSFLDLRTTLPVKTQRQYDNGMLSFLYDIKRRQVALLGNLRQVHYSHYAVL